MKEPHASIKDSARQIKVEFMDDQAQDIKRGGNRNMCRLSWPSQLAMGLVRDGRDGSYLFRDSVRKLFEVLVEEFREGSRLLVVCVLILPCIARDENFGGHIRAGNGNAHAEDGVWPRFNFRQRARENRANHGSRVFNLHALAFA